MATISIRMPQDVSEELKRLAPSLGFSGYQPLARHCIGQGLRADLARLDRDAPIPQLIEILKRRGVDERVIAKAIAEVRKRLGYPTCRSSSVILFLVWELPECVSSPVLCRDERQRGGDRRDYTATDMSARRLHQVHEPRPKRPVA